MLRQRCVHTHVPTVQANGQDKPFILGRFVDGSPHVDRHKPNHPAGVASLEIRAYRSAQAGGVDTGKPAICRLCSELAGASAYGKLVVLRAGEAYDAP
jgi:hypothetical protein